MAVNPNETPCLIPFILENQIVPEKSSFSVRPMKIEIQMSKLSNGVVWNKVGTLLPTASGFETALFSEDKVGNMEQEHINVEIDESSWVDVSDEEDGSKDDCSNGGAETQDATEFSNLDIQGSPDTEESNFVSFKDMYKDIVESQMALQETTSRTEESTPSDSQFYSSLPSNPPSYADLHTSFDDNLDDNEFDDAVSEWTVDVEQEAVSIRLVPRIANVLDLNQIDSDDEDDFEENSSILDTSIASSPSATSLSSLHSSQELHDQPNSGSCINNGNNTPISSPILTDDDEAEEAPVFSRRRDYAGSCSSLSHKFIGLINMGNVSFLFLCPFLGISSRFS